MLKLRSQVIGLIVILVIIFLPVYSKLQELRFENSDLAKKIKRLEQENLALKCEKEKIDKDPVYLEKVAREKIGIVRKGEIVYKVVPEKKNKKPQSTTAKN